MAAAFLRGSILLACALVWPVHAQDAPAGDDRAGKTALRQLRLLPVGEAPVFRGELREGVLHEVEPQPGMLPPLEVQAVLGEGRTARLPILLGSLSAPLEVPVGLPVLRLLAAERDGLKPWLETRLPEGKEPLLLFIWRDPEAGKWTKAQSLLLRDGPLDSPAGSVRVLNLTPGLLAVRFGGEEKPVALQGGRSVRRVAPPGVALPVKIELSDRQGGWIRLLQDEVAPARDERVRIIVYRSDGEQVRRPAKVLVLPERLPAPIPAAG
jgi:hypothetical protein